MKNTLLLLLSWCIFPTYGQNLPKTISSKDFTIGETIEIHSIILDEVRELNIYFPASYNEDTNKRYPVIYLLDGSKDEDFIHVAGIVQFATFPWIKMIPESIVVGISNVDRKRDFTFSAKNKKFLKDIPTSGNSEKFMEFIEEELQPYVDAKYRTKAEKTIIGQSLGGLLATEILFKKPKLFDNYIIVSPSLWWDDKRLLKYDPLKIEKVNAVYIAVGKEGEIMEIPAKNLYEKLQQSAEGIKVYFEFLADKTHGDALHLAVYNAFEKIFHTED